MPRTIRQEISRIGLPIFVLSWLKYNHQKAIKRRKSEMGIKRSGSQSSGKGPAEYFTGSVRIDPLFKASDPSRIERRKGMGKPISRRRFLKKSALALGTVAVCDLEGIRSAVLAVEKKEGTMPHVIVQLYPGRSEQQKIALPNKSLKMLSTL